MKKFLVNFTAIAVVALFLSSCGEDRTFEKQYLESAKEISNILAKYKVCPSIELCRGRGYFFSGPAFRGMEVVVFGSNNNAMLEEISQILTRKFLETPNMQKLTFIANASPLGKKKEIVLTMEMRR